MSGTLCNGMASPRPCYSQEKVNHLIPVINEVRKELKQQYPEADHDARLVCGWRFNNNDIVIATMESCFNQKRLFDRGEKEAARDALINCMDRDYWYMYDKDWGFEDVHYDDDVDEEA